MEGNINFLAVIAAAVSSFLIGGLWYSPLLFAKPWMKANDFTEEFLKQGNMLKIFGGSLLASLVIAVNLGFFLGSEITAGTGAFYGFMTGFGWVMMSLGVVYLFERRSLTLWLINGGYQVITYTLMGLILGLWH